jgi:hypothetical protein
MNEWKQRSNDEISATAEFSGVEGRNALSYSRKSNSESQAATLHADLPFDDLAQRATLGKTLKNQEGVWITISLRHQREIVDLRTVCNCPLPAGCV